MSSARRFVSLSLVGAWLHASCTSEPARDTRTSGPATTSVGTSGAGGGATGTSSGSGTSGVGGGMGGAVGGTSGTSSGAGGATGGGSVATTTGGGSGGTSGGVGGSAMGGSGGTGAGGAPPGVGAPQFKPGEVDAPSNGGTITFQNIGKAGWFPSRRDPATGPCDFANTAGCCKTRFNITSDKLTPWDEDLIMTLRGPLLVKQLVAYQPSAAGAATWQLTSVWDDRSASSPKGVGFNGNRTETTGFNGVVGTECLVDTSTDRIFPCGPGSVPYCPPPGTAKKYYGWEGSKMIVLLSYMPYADSGKVAGPCSQNTTGNWYNAPWIGLSHGELVRADKFGTCHCYSASDPYAGDGCGQFNVFETVNDNNSFRNFDVFSTNFFGYGGYVGEGPCGATCKANLFPAAADLINKTTSLEVAQGVVTGPGRPVGAAFRRPEAGYRYFVMLLDVDTRTVQLAIVHPQKIPAALAGFLPDLPAQIPRSTIDATLALRLPR